MMEWVLILFISYTYGGGLTSIDGFLDEESCITSAKHIKQQNPLDGHIRYSCIEVNKMVNDG